MNKAKWIIGGVLLVVLVIVLTLSLVPKSIDWSLSFSKDHDKPFGTKILFEQLPELFTGSKVITKHGNAFLSYQENEDSTSSNYMLINQNLKLDSAEISNVLKMASAGNNFFIAAQDFSKAWLDSFNLSIEYSSIYNYSMPLVDSVSLNFANRRFQTQLGYWYKKAISNDYFTSYDTLKTTVLGINNRGKTNFIRIKKGKGAIYLHLVPLAFTNYNMLVDDNYAYVSKCLSYLPSQSIVWDEYHKDEKQAQLSMFSFILDRPSLKYGWYIFLVGLIIFFVFQSTRMQRIIPILQEPGNSTISFIETIGRLYFSRKDHLNIAHKKYLHFKEYVRIQYYINTIDNGKECIKKVADKSAVEMRLIKQIIEMGEGLKSLEQLSEDGLVDFNAKIDLFYTLCEK